MEGEDNHELWESVRMNETQPLTGDAIIETRLQRKREGLNGIAVYLVHVHVHMQACLYVCLRARVRSPCKEVVESRYFVVLYIA